MSEKEPNKTKYVILFERNTEDDEDLTGHTQTNEDGITFVFVEKDPKYFSTGSSFKMKQANDRKLQGKKDFLHRCCNRKCKNEDICFASSAELDVHNLSVHVEQWKNLECPICNTKLQKKVNLDAHLKLRHKLKEPKLRTCDFCGGTFRSKNGINQHMSSHIGTNYECSVCKKVFNNLRPFRIHIRRHFEHFKCQDCGIVFERKSTLLKHFVKHNPESHLKCNHCERKFLTDREKISHENLVHKNGKIKAAYKCNVCNEDFGYLFELKNHEVLNHYNGPIFSCEECDRNYKTHSDLLYHMKTHIKKSDFEFFCNLCENVAFKCRRGLIRHREKGCSGHAGHTIKLGKAEAARIARKQFLKTFPNFKNSDMENYTYEPEIVKPVIKAKKTPIRAPIASEATTTVKKTKKTLIISTIQVANEQVTKDSQKEKEKKKFKCKECKKRFTTNNSLKMHKKIHENLREFKCKVEGCSYDTNFEIFLKRHVLRIHVNLRPYECDLCGMTFKERTAISGHIKRNHILGTTKMKCPIPSCNSIILEKYLKVHMKRSHTEKGRARPYVCKICGRAEQSEGLLKKHHERVHEPENRRYKCPDCPEKFLIKHELTAHSFVHYKGVVHVCKTCGRKFKSRENLNDHKNYAHIDLKLPCKFCNEIFKNRNSKYYHMMMKHPEVK